MTITQAFKILGIPEESTKEQIRRRYLTLARSAHPDAGGSMEEFTKINKAYEVAKTRVCPNCKGQGFTLKQVGFSSKRITCAEC